MKSITKIAFFNIIFCCIFLNLTANDDSIKNPTIPFTDSYYYHFSKDQRLSDLIKDFCSMQNISIVVSPMITDVVNGRFNKMSPNDFWDYVTRAYGLTWFYDGKILYVYKGSELQTQVFKMDEAGISTLSNIIKHLGFSSSDFSFRAVPTANILIVTAPPKYLETINDLSVKFVTEKISDTTIVKTFPLKYAWAYDMSFTYKDGSISVPGIATILQNIVTGTQSTFSLSGMDVNLGGKTQNKQNKMQTLVPQTDHTPKNNNENKSSNQGQNSENSQKIQTTSSLPGFITCDQRLNAVIIRDKHENMQFYEDIINQLDVPCEVIKIDVAIVDVNRSNGTDLGLSAIGLNGKHSLNIGISGADSKKQSEVLTGGEANIFNKLNGIVKGYTILSYLQALEDSGNAQTVAKPSVLTLDNVGAIIEKDQTMFSKVSGTYSEGLYDITATTKLQVVPHIIPNERDEHGKQKMKMFVNVQDGSLSGKDQQDATPTSDNNSINTQAVLYEGQSLLIGGYFKEDHSSTVSGLPIIQNLPLIGNAFKRTINSKSIKERVYVISPSIVDINSQDHKYDRFLQNGELTATAILNSDEFSMKKPWPSKIKKNKPPLRGTGN